MTVSAIESFDAPRDLLERAQSGDREAFASIIREHEAMVFSIALHFTRDRDLADDIAQDVFVQLFENVRSIESPEHLLFWLRRVVSNRCIDRSRRAESKTVPLQSIDVASDDCENDPLLRRRLETSLGELTPPQRLCLALRYQEDLEPAEISRIAGLPLATVKSHLYRALRTLRKRLSPSGGSLE